MIESIHHTPSRSSWASWIPVDAPDGTAARNEPARRVKRANHRALRIRHLTGSGGHVNLDGGVAAAVVDLAGVNLEDLGLARERVSLLSSAFFLTPPPRGAHAV